uniref:Epoxide hydrolase n=1 Tax=Panagrolaimus superbus TaxID=310955 RepID=A0A914XW55_9BILA
MGRLSGSLAAIAVISIAYLQLQKYFVTHKKHVKPTFPRHGFYGPGRYIPDDERIHTFHINVSDKVIIDLGHRLREARINHEQLEDVSDFSYGFNKNTLQEFLHYWKNDYSWKDEEAKINIFSHFTTQIEGLNVHYIHAKPPLNKYQKIVPLLLVHGWPGNFYEFYKLIPLLTDPGLQGHDTKRTAFEVIVPSIPGFGFSEASHKSGFDQIATARIFKKLMVDRLDFMRFLAHGGDWGSLIVSNIAREFPEHLYGIHLNNVLSVPTIPRTIIQILGSYFPSLTFLSDTPQNYSFKEIFMEKLFESGYLHIQATKPDTIGVALNDSPIGLMAWILEKFSSLTNKEYRKLSDGGLEKKFTKDELLTIVMIYWINGNILSSQRYYKEFFSHPDRIEFSKEYIDVPVGVLAFPNDFGGFPTPAEMLSSIATLKHYKVMENGGHFAALEEPVLLASDIYEFVVKIVPEFDFEVLVGSM